MKEIKLKMREKNLLILLLFDEKKRQEKMLKKFKNDEFIEEFIKFIDNTIKKLSD